MCSVRSQHPRDYLYLYLYSAGPVTALNAGESVYNVPEY